MNRIRALVWVNSLLGVVLVLHLTTVMAMVMVFSFGKGPVLFGIPVYIWTDLHKIMGITLITLIITHVTLNWGWVKSTILGLKPHIQTGK